MNEAIIGQQGENKVGFMKVGKWQMAGTLS